MTPDDARFLEEIGKSYSGPSTHRLLRIVVDLREEVENLKWLQDAREGDFELARAFAGNLGIKLKNPNNCPGGQWEELVRGGEGILRERDALKTELAKWERIAAERLGMIRDRDGKLADAEARIKEITAIAVKAGAAANAPCAICGYNGPGYFKPETHSCMKHLTYFKEMEAKR